MNTYEYHLSSQYRTLTFFFVVSHQERGNCLYIKTSSYTNTLYTMIVLGWVTIREWYWCVYSIRKYNCFLYCIQVKSAQTPACILSRQLSDLPDEIKRPVIAGHWRTVTDVCRSRRSAVVYTHRNKNKTTFLRPVTYYIL